MSWFRVTVLVLYLLVVLLIAGLWGLWWFGELASAHAFAASVGLAVAPPLLYFAIWGVVLLARAAVRAARALVATARVHGSQRRARRSLVRAAGSAARGPWYLLVRADGGRVDLEALGMRSVAPPPSTPELCLWVARDAVWIEVPEGAEVDPAALLAASRRRLAGVLLVVDEAEAWVARGRDVMTWLSEQVQIELPVHVLAAIEGADAPSREVLAASRASGDDGLVVLRTDRGLQESWRDALARVLQDHRDMWMRCAAMELCRSRPGSRQQALLGSPEALEGALGHLMGELEALAPSRGAEVRTIGLLLRPLDGAGGVSVVDDSIDDVSNNRDLLHAVMDHALADRLLVRPTDAWSQRRRRRANLAFGAVTVAVMSVVAVGRCVVVRNAELVTAVAGETRPAAERSALASATSLRGLLDLDRQLARRSAGLLGVALYQGAALRPHVRALLERRMFDEVISGLLEDERARLVALADAYAGRDESPPLAVELEALAGLTLFLSIEAGGSQATETPLVARLEQLWTRALPEASPVASETRRELLEIALASIAADPERRVELSRSDRERAQSVLRRRSPSERWFLEFAQSTPLDEAAITTRALLGDLAPSSDRGAPVPSIYSAAGWRAFVSRVSAAELVSQVHGHDFALGFLQPAPSTEAVRGALCSRYNEGQNAAWGAAIDGLAVVEPRDLPSARDILVDLSRAGGRLDRLFGRVAAELDRSYPSRVAPELRGDTRLVASSVPREVLGAAQRVTDALPGCSDIQASVRLEFAGLLALASSKEEGDPLGEIRAHLADAATILGEHLEGATSPDEASEALAQTRRGIERWNAAQADRWRPMLARLTVDVVVAAERLIERAGAGQLSARWCAQVVSPFQEATRGYPFSRSLDDARLADVSAVFAPESGALWIFLKTDLATILSQGPEGFTLTARGEKLGIDPALAGFYTAAGDVRRVLFATDATAPSLAMTATLASVRNAREIALVVDDSEARWTPMPTGRAPVEWTGSGAAAGASLLLRTSVLEQRYTQRGSWGLWRLIEDNATSLERGPDGAIVARFPIQADAERDIEVRLTPARPDTPLFGVAARPTGPMEVFRQRALQIPRTLSSGAAPCHRIPAVTERHEQGERNE